MSISDTDIEHEHMRRAIELAQNGLYTSRQNPRVGAVIAHDRQIVGEGWHHRPHAPHAEIMALQSAGTHALGATCYVSLEPCCHHGKTPPCTQALVKAGIKRLIYGHEDPNPQVAGAGIAYLREHGIQVDGPVMEIEARRLNMGFIKRMHTGYPWVRIKLAMSLDGRTAMANGQSFWISGLSSRTDVQRLRARSCAIISSYKTVQRDQASLSVRPQEFGLAEELKDIDQPLRVLVDSRCQVSSTLPFFNIPAPVLLVSAMADSEIKTSTKNNYNDCVATVEMVNLPDAEYRGVDLTALLSHLAERQINEVLVEAGSTLAGAFMRRGLVDEIYIYMAPKLMGSLGMPLFHLPLQDMRESLPLHIKSIINIGDDIKIIATPALE